MMEVSKMPVPSFNAALRTNQVRNIKLYGSLGAQFGRSHKMAVGSASEAVRALGSQLRGFEAHLTQSKDKGIAYAVFYGKKNLAEGELHDPAGDEEIRIAPVVLGSKKAGVFQIILGAVLVVVGLLITGASWGALAPLGGIMVNMGIALIIGGIIQLLSPSPKGRAAQDRPEDRPSYSFNGPVNTQAQGNPVQVLYGELIVGRAVLSAGINAVDDVYVPRNGSGYGGGASPWHLEWIAHRVLDATF